jgi:diadenosine tetraphosphate (Ap4A) HIT family hydrolase
VFGHQQFVHGYLLLLPDPVVADLNALTPENRSQFLIDMSKLGDALVRTTSPVRINYAIFGNVEPALHAHVIPRYRNEPENMRSQQPWAYDWNAAPAFDAAAAAPMMRQLRAELAKLGALRTP